MKKIQSIWTLAALAMALGVGTSLMAQEPSQPTQPPTAPTDQPSQTQPPAQAQPPANQQTPTSDQSQQTSPPDQQSQPQAQPGQTPDSSAQSAQDSGKTFSGMINKQGDQYVLQSADGTVYNIDNQAAAKKYEGKKVNIHGTLDADGKTIHVQ